MSGKHPWSEITFDALGGEISVTNFTCSTTCTGLVARPGHKLRIFQILVSAPDISQAEGIGDVNFTDG